MIARIRPRPLRGKLRAIPSKSEAHRLLICAALADAPTQLVMGEGNQDIDATIRCLTALGARIERNARGLRVSPIARARESCAADCGESGSTLRFLLPVAAALGADARFLMRGRLPQRPIAPLDRALESGGCALSRPEEAALRIRGKLRPGKYALPGDVSSQYISGMLMALSVAGGESELRVEGRLESADYVEMTVAALTAFGAKIARAGNAFRLPTRSRLESPGEISVGGDWSNAAFWLCANALPGCAIELSGLDEASAQGDRRIVSEIAKLRARGETPARVDASNIPDLMPALAACAAGLERPLIVENAARLRIKESDRISAICGTIRALGGRAQARADSLDILPAPLRGGDVDACGDHRIAMMAAVASIACSGEVRISGAEAVNKSYPGFWRDFRALGGDVELSEEENA